MGFYTPSLLFLSTPPNGLPSPTLPPSSTRHSWLHSAGVPPNACRGNETSDHLQGRGRWVCWSHAQPSASSSTQPGRPPQVSLLVPSCRGCMEEQRLEKGGWVGLQCVQKVRDALGPGKPHSLEPRPPPPPTPSSDLQQGPAGAIPSPARQAPEEGTDPSPAGRLLRQAAQGRLIPALKLPHFEFRNCGNV